MHVGVTRHPTDAWVTQQFREATPCGGSVRRECLDHVLVLGAAYLRRVLREYVHYFNRDRPHQGLTQRVPEAPEAGSARPLTGGSVRAIPILGGLHHAYTRAA